MKFIKANWRLIVGVLFVISAVSSLVVLDFVGVIVCGAIGGGLIFWQYKDANRDKPAEYEARPVKPAKAAPPAGAAAPEQKPDTYTRKFKVRGVTFNNDDGTSRQEILKKIYRKKPPFDNGLNVELKEYTYDDGPTFGVYVNGYMIGNIPGDDTDFINRARRRGVEVVGFKVDYFEPEDESERGRVYYARIKLEIVPIRAAKAAK